MSIFFAIIGTLLCFWAFVVGVASPIGDISSAVLLGTGVMCWGFGALIWRIDLLRQDFRELASAATARSEPPVLMESLPARESAPGVDIPL